MNKKQPHYFKYKYLEGPLSLEELSKAKFVVGNCRRAIQDYLYFKYDIYLSPEQVMAPYSFYHTGSFISQDENIDFSLYKTGDIIYAQNIRNKNKELISHNRKDYSSKDEWITHLHTAIYLGDKKIYHATIISGETCIWDFDK